MSQRDIREAIDELKKGVTNCNTSSIILSSTASMKNTSTFFQNKISKYAFKQNGEEIAILGAEFMKNCKCASIVEQSKK